MQQILFTENIIKNKRCFQLARLYETVWAYAMTTNDSQFMDEWVPIANDVFQDLIVIDNGNVERISDSKLNSYFEEIAEIIERGQQRRKLIESEAMDTPSSSDEEMSKYGPGDNDLLNLAEDICRNDFNALKTFMRSLVTTE